MAAIILPQQWVSQPQIATNVARTPFNAGLVYAADFGQFRLLNRVNGSLGSVTGTKVAPSLPGLVTGFGATSGSASSDIITTSFIDNPLSNNYRTYLFRYLANTSGGGGFGRIFSKGGGTAGSESVACNGTNLTLSRSVGGSASWSRGTDGVWHTCLVSSDGSAVPNVWLDGVSVSASAGGFGTSAADTSPFVIGNRQSPADRGWDGYISFLFIFNRLATAQDAADLTRNPWQLFAPLPRRAWVSVASGTPTGTLATTNANDTLAASGSAVGFTGTLAKTNANDTLAGVGTQTNTGTLATTNANDTLAGVGYLPATGTLAITAANDSLDASGTAGAAAGGSYGGKRKYVVKVGNQLMVFAKEADAVNALPKPEKKNIPAKRGKKPVEAKEAPKPDVAISLDEIKRQADLTQMRAEVDRLLEMRRYEALISLYEEMIDEEEVEMLLLAA